MEDKLTQVIIQDKIKQIEVSEKIEVLYAVESGSRAWGFASSDSDYDVRFIYVKSKDWFLSVEKKKDTIDILNGDYDLAGWDLKKTLELFRKSNPPLLEWFRSPIVYKQNKKFVYDFRELESEAFDPKSCIFHYLSIAKNNYRNYIRNQKLTNFKKYFYVLRALFACQYIVENNKIPPIEFKVLLKYMKLNKAITSEIYRALVIKKGSIETAPRRKVSIWDKFIKDSIMHYERNAKDMTTKQPISNEKLNNLFMRYIK